MYLILSRNISQASWHHKRGSIYRNVARLNYAKWAFITHHRSDAKKKVLTFFSFQSSNLAHSTDLDAAKTMATTRSPQTPQKTCF